MKFSKLAAPLITMLLATNGGCANCDDCEECLAGASVQEVGEGVDRAPAVDVAIECGPFSSYARLRWAPGIELVEDVDGLPLDNGDVVVELEAEEQLYTFSDGTVVTTRRSTTGELRVTFGSGSEASSATCRNEAGALQCDLP